MTTHAPRLVGTLAGCAVAAAALIAPAGLAAHEPLLPDLVADPVTTALTSVETLDRDQGDRLLLRFPGYVHNSGPGRLEIVGRRPEGDWRTGGRRMTDVIQRLYDQNGNLEGERISRVRVERAAADAPSSHQHWHVMRAAAYALVDAATRSVVADGAKVGFCLADTSAIEADPSDARYDAGSCNGVDAEGSPLDHDRSQDAVAVTMGISPGFRDTYGAQMWTQWVDLTGRVAPGRYRIRSTVDPEDVIFEADESNPPSDGPEIALRGWLAQPRTAPPAPAGATQRIVLAATEVAGGGALPAGDRMRGRPGPVQYGLASPPAHGTVTLSGNVASYTPDAGYRGADSFSFTAAEAGSRLARPPAAVAVTVQGGEAESGGGGSEPSLTPPPPPPPPPARTAARRALIAPGSLTVARGTVTARFRVRTRGILTVTLLGRGRVLARWRGPVVGGRRVTLRRRVGSTTTGRLVAVAVLTRGGRVIARARTTRSSASLDPPTRVR